jgi:hypothetical protein
MLRPVAALAEVSAPPEEPGRLQKMLNAVEEAKQERKEVQASGAGARACRLACWLGLARRIKCSESCRQLAGKVVWLCGWYRGYSCRRSRAELHGVVCVAGGGCRGCCGRRRGHRAQHCQGPERHTGQDQGAAGGGARRGGRKRPALGALRRGRRGPLSVPRGLLPGCGKPRKLVPEERLCSR